MSAPAARSSKTLRCLLLAGAGALVWAPADAVAADPPPPDDEPPSTLEKGTEAVILPVRVAHRRRRISTRLRRRVASLNALLTDTAQDLGLVVDLTERPHTEDTEHDEYQLVQLAEQSGKLTVLPILEVDPRQLKEGMLELRVLAARPGSRVLTARVEQVQRGDLAVRAVVMLRDVVTEAGPRNVVHAVERQPPPAPEPAFSSGRAILATTGTLFGGFMGYSLQRASGSEDPRLLYPLMTVGAGVGLGGAIIVADEWNVGVGDAWYLGAGALWPAVGSHLIYEGHFADSPSMPEGEQWGFGLVASTVGIGLSAVGLVHRSMGDGEAALAHSGGGAGLVVGALAELAVTGSEEEEVPLAGMGYGALGGWLLGATAAMLIEAPADRVLTIDLGVALGGLAGASAASPLLFGENSASEVRGWVAAAGGGMLAGGAVAWYLSRDEPPEETTEAVRADPTSLVYRWGSVHPIVLGGPLQPTSAPARTGLTGGAGEARFPAAPGLGWHAVLW